MTWPEPQRPSPAVVDGAAALPFGMLLAALLVCTGTAGAPSGAAPSAGGSAVPPDSGTVPPVPVPPPAPPALAPDGIARVKTARPATGPDGGTSVAGDHPPGAALPVTAYGSSVSSARWSTQAPDIDVPALPVGSSGLGGVRLPMGTGVAVRGGDDVPAGPTTGSAPDSLPAAPGRPTASAADGAVSWPRVEPPRTTVRMDMIPPSGHAVGAVTPVPLTGSPAADGGDATLPGATSPAGSETPSRQPGSSATLPAAAVDAPAADGVLPGLPLAGGPFPPVSQFMGPHGPGTAIEQGVVSAAHLVREGGHPQAQPAVLWVVLDPPELGRVELRIRLTRPAADRPDGALEVDLKPETAAGYNLLAGTLEGLKESLQSRGLVLAGLNLFDPQGGGSRRQARPQPGGSPARVLGTGSAVGPLSDPTENVDRAAGRLIDRKV